MHYLLFILLLQALNSNEVDVNVTRSVSLHQGVTSFNGLVIDTVTTYSWLIETDVAYAIHYTSIYYEHGGTECGKIIIFDMFANASNNQR